MISYQFFLPFLSKLFKLSKQKADRIRFLQFLWEQIRWKSRKSIWMCKRRNNKQQHINLIISNFDNLQAFFFLKFLRRKGLYVEKGLEEVRFHTSKTFTTIGWTLLTSSYEQKHMRKREKKLLERFCVNNFQTKVFGERLRITEDFKAINFCLITNFPAYNKSTVVAFKHFCDETRTKHEGVM